MKQAIIIHQWGGHPADNFYPWLKNELEGRGYSVAVPDMPDTDHPKIEPWVKALTDIFTDDTALLVGHSVGCQTILRYLADNTGQKVDAILVAGWFSIKGLQPESWAVADPWLKTPLDFDAASRRLRKVLPVFSTNDQFIPIENAKFFEEKLRAKPLVLENRGHFESADGVTQIPELLPWLDDLARA